MPGQWPAWGLGRETIDTGQRRRDIVVMDWDGAAISKLTSASQNILPSWSPSEAYRDQVPGRNCIGPSARA